MIPPDVLAEIQPREDDEHAKRDHFLNDFQLKGRELAVANAIRRDLKAVFGEGYQPAYDDGGKERSFAVFQVAVPRDGHENIGADQKEDGFHGTEIVSREQLRRLPSIFAESMTRERERRIRQTEKRRTESEMGSPTHTM